MKISLLSINSLQGQEKISRYAIYLFYILIISIFLLRIRLIGQGITHFADEVRYFNSIEAVKEFAQGNFKRGITLLNSTQGRPGDAFIRLLPAIVQAVMYKALGINTVTPQSLVVAVWMNWIVLIINTVLFYKVAVRFHSISIAQVATVVYVTLINSNIYLRHILPYDIAIGLFLWALLLVLREQASYTPVRRSVYVKAGVLSGLCFAVYPGYFLAPLIVGVMAIDIPIKRFKAELARLFASGLLFVLGFGGVLLLFELIATGGSSSYLMSSRELSTTINQGDFSAGFSFAPEYLLVVEKLMGWVLLGLLPVAATLLTRSTTLLSNHAVTPRVQLEKLAILLGFGWFSYASLAYFGHSLVFYGRTLHLFIPLLVLVCAHVLLSAKSWNIRIYTTFCCAAMLVCMASFVWFYIGYVNLGYEKDILFQHGIHNPLPEHTWRYNTVCSAQDNFTTPFQHKYISDDKNNGFKSNDTLVMVNFGYIFPACASAPIKIPNQNRLQLLVKAPVTTTYVPYQFEGWNAKERKILNNGEFNFAVYKLAPTKQ
jgi:hypothetical protein